MLMARDRSFDNCRAEKDEGNKKKKLSKRKRGEKKKKLSEKEKENGV